MDKDAGPITRPDTVPEVVADTLDDSRLADILDDSPERLNYDPLPSRPAFPANRRPDDSPQTTFDSAQTKDHQPSATSGHDEGHGTSNRTSMSHWDPEPGFAHVDGEIGGSGYNETKVDIITVPCPGADPVETWTRDPLPDGFFGNPADHEMTSHPTLKELAGDAILTPGIGGHFPRAAHLWVRQGIRRYASTARVMLYRHRELAESTNLDDLAQDLLDNVSLKREGHHQSRPVFFIAHSIGGLVVKRALLMAKENEQYRGILYNCHGISFFATPHRGSSYMSMYNLRDSIQRLLHLQRPLPRSLMEDIRLMGNKSLLQMHEDFTDISSEMRIWTFYETIDSQLSGSGLGFDNEVQFSAPLVSIKSAIVGVRQETIYSALESDHAHCASFGITNPRTLGTYLQDLAAAVAKAENLSKIIHTSLKLKEKVKVEIVGFYDDPDTESESDIRLYITKYHLAEFLQKGPERCLEERLRRVPRRPGTSDQTSTNTRNRGVSGSGMSIIGNVQRFWSTVTRPQDHERHVSPNFVVTPPSARPIADDERSPFIPGNRQHSLTLPALSTPGFQRPSSRSSIGTTSTMSDPTGREISPREVDAATKEHYYNGHRSNSDAVGLGLKVTDRGHFKNISRAAALQDWTAGFSRPDPDRRKFMWIHMPVTNPLWVKDVFETLSETQDINFSKLFNNENWVSRHVSGRHSQSQPSFVKPAVHFMSADFGPSPRLPHAHTPPAKSSASPNYLYLFLPYLHFDTYRHVIKRRVLINRRLAHGRAKPVPEDIAALDSLELRVIWEYLGYDPPLNCRRTLDQFGYPSLKDTYARDDDQMLYKLTKEDVTRKPVRPTDGGIQSVGSLSTRYSFGTQNLHKMIQQEKENTSDSESEIEQGLRDGNLLMVDQLWLWAIDTTTLTTFFPKRESRPSEGALFQQADLRDSIYNELNGDLSGRCENALDLAAFVTLHAVTVLLDRTSHPDLDIFRIFEEAIGMLTEGMTRNLKSFRLQGSKNPGVDSGDDPEENNPASIKKRHKLEIEKAEQENRDNTSALLELRDMEDELNTLNKLFDTQVDKIGEMLKIYTGDALKDITIHGQGYLQEALGRLAEYKSQTDEMIHRVTVTRGDYEKTFEMLQRQAQVDDMRWTRGQTELASSQNLSVMIFTVFTVIFLPLSFFTSVFGMNTSEWGGPDNKDYPSMGYIGIVSLPASVLVILLTLVVAFSSHVQRALGAVFRWTRRLLEHCVGALGALEPERARQAKLRRRAEREREGREEREQKRKETSFDFWSTVRRRRTLGAYQIPDVNRKKTMTGLEGAGTGGGSGTGMGI